jgi:hypothetical protein
MATKSTKSTKPKTPRKVTSKKKVKNSIWETGLLRSPQKVSVAVFAFLVLFVGVGVYVYQSTHAATQTQVEAFSPTSSDCLAGGQSAGSGTYIAGCNGSAGENWQMTGQTINNPTDHTCLEMHDVPTSGNPAVEVLAESCNGSSLERWEQASAFGGPTYEMVNEASSTRHECLVDPNTALGATIEATECHTASPIPTDQEWFNGTYNAEKPPKPSSGPGCATGIRASAATAQCISKELIPNYGWSVSGQFGCLQELWNQESSWRWNADNASSGAYGIPQSLPGNKMASIGPDWQTNATTQIKWGLQYIKGRYGTPCAAEAHEKGYGWYGVTANPNGTQTTF